MDIYNNLFIRFLNENDENALKELIEMTNKWLGNVVYRILKDKDETEDVLQETWIKIWEYRNRFNEVKNFRNWIYTIAINKSYKILKKKKGTIKLSLEENNEQFGVVDCDFELSLDVLENYIEKLDNLCKNLIYLKYYDGFSYEDISQTLGFNLNFVRNHLFRCRKKLYELLVEGGFVL